MRNEKDPNNVASSIMAAYIVLILNILLVAGVGFVVVFLQGLATYMFWILLGGSAAVAASGYLIYRRLQQEGRNLGELMKMPVLRDRSVEVSVLGGLASVRIGRPEQPIDIPVVNERITAAPKQLEDPEAIHLRELSELVRLLEKDLITWDEYCRAKKDILRN